MSKKLLTAIKQLNKVQYLPKGSEIKVPLLEEQIDIESLKDKDYDELEDIFFEAIDSIIETLEEFIPEKLVTLYWVIYEQRELSELSMGGAGTGFVPDQDKNCPVCGKNLDISKKKPPFDDYFCQHVLLMTRPLFDGPKFSYVNKTKSEVADELIKKDSGEHYKGLDKQMKEYADCSEGKYEVIEIINYNSTLQETSYYLIEIKGKKILDSDAAATQDPSVKKYTEAISKNPDDAQSYIDRGLSYYDLDKYQNAIDDYTKAIRLEPDSEAAYYNRGRAYHGLGQYQNAIDDYTEAGRLEPRDTDTYYNKACCLALQKKAEEACECIRIAIKQGDNDWQRINKDKDFDNIKSETCFIDLIKQMQFGKGESSITKEEIAIQADMFKAIVNTFAHPKDEKLKDNPVVQKVMLEFAGRIIQDILAMAKQSKKGISFPVLKNAFCYLFAKTADAVLTAHNEKGILSGTNLPYDFNDIQSGACGVSRWFSKYNADPDDECALGEQYFFSFQDICVKYQDQIQKSSPLLAQLIIGAMTAMIPYAIQRGYEIIEK